MSWESVGTSLLNNAGDIVKGAATVGSAIYGANAASDAADAQAQAADKSIALQAGMYDQNRADLAPYRYTGNNALSRLAAMYGVATPDNFNSSAYLSANPEVAQALKDGSYNGVANNFGDAYQHYLLYGQQQGRDAPLIGADDWKNSPSYQFRMEEGQKALDRSAASKGMLLSGAQQKATEKYGQGLATQEFDTQANRLAALAGIGQSATNTTAGLGAQTAGGMASATMTGGAAQASGYVGSANAVNKGISNLLYAYGGK